MRTITATAVLIGLVGSGVAQAKPVAVSLQDYAFNFPAHGYEIVVNGRTGNPHYIAVEDMVLVKDGSYTVTARIDRLSRSDRQQFMTFYAEHCKFTKPCEIRMGGEVELDKELRMKLFIQGAELSRNGSSVTIGVPLERETR